MLTVDFDRLGVGPGTKAIDIGGAGQGRHSFEMFRRGADVIAFDMSESDMADVAEMFDAMTAEGHVPLRPRRAPRSVTHCVSRTRTTASMWC